MAPLDLLHFAERGSGPPLLLVRGLMVSGEMFEQVLGHFAARHWNQGATSCRRRRVAGGGNRASIRADPCGRARSLGRSGSS